MKIWWCYKYNNNNSIINNRKCVEYLYNKIYGGLLFVCYDDVFVALLNGYYLVLSSSSLSLESENKIKN